MGELLRGGAIIKADVTAAVEAFMAEPKTTRFAVGGRYVIDLAVAVGDCAYTAGMLADLDIDDRWKRSAVRTAILLARPVKG